MRIREHGLHALRQADLAAKRGYLAIAERWTKLAAQAATHYERLNAKPLAPPPEEDEDAIREEILRRLARFDEFDKDVTAWERERDAWVAFAREAARTGKAPPPPLRPHPAGEGADADAHYKHLLQGPEPDDGR